MFTKFTSLLQSKIHIQLELTITSYGWCVCLTDTSDDKVGNKVINKDTKSERDKRVNKTVDSCETSEERDGHVDTGTNSPKHR